MDFLKHPKSIINFIKIMNTNSFTKLGILAMFLLLFAIPCLAQQAVMCYKSDGKTQMRCGSGPWTEYKDGVAYDVWCDCSKTPPYVYKRQSSSSSSSSGSSSSGYSPEVQMLESLLQPVFDNLVKGFITLLSGSSPGQIQRQKEREDEKEREKREKAIIEYNKNVLEQITNAKSEFEKQIMMQTEQKKAEIVSALKDRYAVAEATKSVKQLNCAAFSSLESTKLKIDDFNGSKELETSLEQASNLLDFTNLSSNDCPPITVQIPEVNANQPVSFQEMFYNYIVNQSDSIRSTIDTLKIQKEKNVQVLEENNQKVKKASKKVEEQKIALEANNSTTNPSDNQLLIDAMNELEEAENGLQTAKEIEQKIKEEINQKEKHIDALTKMRATYDIPKKQTSTEQPTNK